MNPRVARRWWRRGVDGPKLAEEIDDSFALLKRLYRAYPILTGQPRLRLSGRWGTRSPPLLTSGPYLSMGAGRQPGWVRPWRWVGVAVLSRCRRRVHHRKGLFSFPSRILVTLWLHEACDIFTFFPCFGVLCIYFLSFLLPLCPDVLPLPELQVHCCSQISVS